MIFKRFKATAGALILALASLFSLAFTSQAHASGNLYWCEFSSNSNWSIASNWNTNSSCSGGTNRVPVSGDALVFDNTALTSVINVTDDIPGLDLNSIRFQGTGSGGYNLMGDDISLDAGITDTTSGAGNQILNNFTLTADQSFDTSLASLTISIDGTINLGSNNLTLVANSSSELDINNTISGSGKLTLASPPGSIGYYVFADADTSFTGPVVIESNALGADLSGSLNAFGSGEITVNDGGSLYLSSTNVDGTLTNDLNLAGSGPSGSQYSAITSCLDSCTNGSDTILTLSGNVRLSDNTVLVNGAYSVGESSPPVNTATFDFTGSGTYNGFTLAGLANSSTIVDPPAPVPTPSGSGSGSSSGSTASVKAPDTGEALSSDKSHWPVLGATLITLALVTATVVVSKRSDKVK